MDKETSEIAKLAEKISKDPKSKLFVPLAEEYKRAGDLEMSIHVLTEGIKNNPGYVTARSFLGRLLFEKGDLEGAQKEFEEVAKAIPDNLMAQRKLGDLFVLQNRSADALKHYKSALSLNPGDEDMALLVADLEAGRDVKDKLLKTKQQAKEGPAQQVPVREKVKPQAPPTVKKQPGPVQTTMYSDMSSEEPEEVLIVEPLEPEGLNQEALLTERAGQDKREISREPEKPAETKMPDAEFDFLEEKGLEVEAAVFPEESAGTGVGTAERDQSESSPSSVISEPSFVGPEPEVKTQDSSAEKADDFTTDTLAELYIAQGFYEKAIDIYQRMLAENPHSKSINDKLKRVRTLASQAESAESFMAEDEPAPAVKEEVIYLGGPEQPAESGSVPKFETGADEHVPPAAKETKEFTPPKQFDVGFEPAEYAPPRVAEQHRTTEKKSQQFMKSPSAGRKETIERLESWLKNIMKER